MYYIEELYSLLMNYKETVPQISSQAIGGGPSKDAAVQIFYEYLSGSREYSVYFNKINSDADQAISTIQQGSPAILGGQQYTNINAVEHARFGMINDALQRILEINPKVLR